jgi:hypothetical protein
VTLSDKFGLSQDTEIYHLKKSVDVNLNQFIEKAYNMVGDEAFFLYDAFYNNCQYFISYLLKANDIFTKEAKEFLFQDISEFVKELPEYVHKFGRKVTDIGARLSELIGGCNSCCKAKATRKVIFDRFN